MYQVQLLLPLYDNEGRAFVRAEFDRVRNELAAEFGGVTAYRRAPAEGVWHDGTEVNHDEIVSFEVLAEQLDRAWWARYRNTLATRFRQEEIMITATQVERL